MWDNKEYKKGCEMKKKKKQTKNFGLNLIDKCIMFT